MEISDIRRIGGCVIRINVLGLLFDKKETEDIIPTRLRATCKKQLTKTCNMFDCEFYRTGTLGSFRISWDRIGARM